MTRTKTPKPKKPATGSPIIPLLPGLHNRIKRMERTLRIEAELRPDNVVFAMNERFQAILGREFNHNGDVYANIQRLHPTKGCRVESICRS